MAKSFEKSTDPFTQYFDETWKMGEIKQYYNEHAEDYAKVSKIYGGAATAIQTLLEVVGKDAPNLKVLDVACGTGLVGRHLKKHGVTNIDGLDISDQMLEIAKKDGVYKNYIVGDVTQKIESIATGTYDALICSAAISCGLIRACAFDEFVRLVHLGGFVCFTMRKDTYDNRKYGYWDKLNELVDNGKWKEIKNFVAPYIEDSHLEFQKECHILCYEVLKN